MGNIGPFVNRQETYSYTDVPFCTKYEIKKPSSLGDALTGNEMTDIGYELEFKQDKTDILLCSKKMSVLDMNAFTFAINHDYYYQLFIG